MFFSFFTGAISGITLGLLIFAIITIIIIIVFFCVHSQKKKRFLSSADSAIVFENKLKDYDFKIHRTASVLSTKLYVDDEKKQWVLKTGNKSVLKIYSFNKLLGYEKNIVSTNIYLHINIDDSEHSTRTVRFISDYYSLNEKETMINNLTVLLDYILENK